MNKIPTPKAEQQLTAIDFFSGAGGLTVIDRIVIYSRPIAESDHIAGKKKAGQQIPTQLAVKLKLPQDFLSEALMASSRQNAVNRAVGRN